MHAAVVVREALYRQVNDMYLSARKEQRKEKGTAPQGKKKRPKEPHLSLCPRRNFIQAEFRCWCRRVYVYEHISNK